MVIQRWQSLLLLIACVTMAIFTFSSLGQWQTEAYTYDFTTLGIYAEGEATDGAVSGLQLSTWFLFVISLLSTVLPLIDIFLFRNLRLQKRLCLISALLICATAVVTFVIGYSAIANYTIGWSSALIALPIALVACLVARRQINKDQKLLRSVDTIR